MKNFARIILIILLVQLIYSVGFSQNRQIRGDSISLRYGGYFGGVVEIDGITYHNYYQVKEVATATDDHDAVPLFQIIDSINAGTSGSTYWQQSGDSLFLKNSSNYVGIGTNTPATKLEVVGDLTVGGHIPIINTGHSVFIGEDAGLNDNLSDNLNVFIGYYAGKYTTTGYYNVIIGAGAFRSNTVGYYNTAIGAGALDLNTSGNYNTAIGANSLYSNTTGHNNTATGEGALFYNTSGNYNVVYGKESLYSNTTGHNNIGIGYYAGSTETAAPHSSNETGERNIYIGSSTTTLVNGSTNETAIGHNTEGQGTNTVTLGHGVHTVYINDDGTGDLKAGGIYDDSDTKGTTGQKLTSTGTGLSWVNDESVSGSGTLNQIPLWTPDGSTLGNSIMSESSDVITVAGDLTINTNGTSTLISTYKGVNSDGHNIFIGGGGQSSIGEVGVTSKGSYNTASGVNALRYNTTGSYNTASGVNALNSNTTGYSNSAVGRQALNSNTTGYFNSAVGTQALYSNTTGYFNSAMGMQALYSNTSGSNNSAVGMYALYNLNILDATGANTAIGYNTGRGIVTGSNNSIFGANVTGLDAALSNNIILANGTGAIKAQHDGTDWTLTGRVKTTDFTMTNGAANGYMLQSDAFGDASWVATDAYSQDLGFTASAGTVTISDGTDVTIGGFSTTDSDYGLVPGTDRGNTYYINGAGSWSVPEGTIKRIAKSLTSSEVNGLGTEFDIINAPGTGKYILIHDATCKVTVTTQLEIGTQELSIIYADVSATNAIYRFTNSSIESSSTSRWPKAQPTSLIEIEENKAVAVRLAGSTDPVSGSVTMDFTILYTIEDY